MQIRSAGQPPGFCFSYLVRHFVGQVEVLAAKEDGSTEGSWVCPHEGRCQRTVMGALDLLADMAGNKIRRRERRLN